MSRIDQYPQAGGALAGLELVGNDVADTTQGSFGSTKRIFADQLPSLAHGAAPGSGMTSLYAAIANRNSARVDIPVIGDSVTEGQGATGFTSRWIAHANRALRIAYPTTLNGTSGGLGFIPVQGTGETTYTWPVTLASGSVTSFDLGPVRDNASLAAAGSWTWTAPPGTTSVKVMYFDGTTAGTFSYKVGSGSATNVSNTSTAAELLTASIPITAGQVLTIAWVSGAVFIDGLLHFAGDESSGVTLHGCGHFGWYSGTGGSGWNQPENSGGSFNWAQAFANGFPQVAALGIMLGINDASTSAGNRTAAQFASDMEGLITTIRGAASALTSIPLLLIAPYSPDETFTDSGGWPAYVTALRTVAAAEGNAYVWDLSYRVPAFGASGPLQYDTLHPSNLGHALIGEFAAAGLRIA